MKKTYSKTNRGFDLIEFRDSNGAKCSLQKSSVAGSPCIWFGTESNRMHLSQEQVDSLLGNLKLFVETGEITYESAHPEELQDEVKEITIDVSVKFDEELVTPTPASLEIEEAAPPAPHDFISYDGGGLVRVHSWCCLNSISNLQLASIDSICIHGVPWRDEWKMVVNYVDSKGGNTCGVAQYLSGKMASGVAKILSALAETGK